MPNKLQTEGRQGDICFRKIESIPEGNYEELARDLQGRIIVALGEVTGHSHSIADVEVKMIEMDNKDRYIVADRPFTLAHDEHSKHHFAPGIYEVLYQTEYVEEQIRQVVD